MFLIDHYFCFCFSPKRTHPHCWLLDERRIVTKITSFSWAPFSVEQKLPQKNHVCTALIRGDPARDSLATASKNMSSAKNLFTFLWLKSFTKVNEKKNKSRMGDDDTGGKFLSFWHQIDNKVMLFIGVRCGRWIPFYLLGFALPHEGTTVPTSIRTNVISFKKK